LGGEEGKVQKTRKVPRKRGKRPKCQGNLGKKRGGELIVYGVTIEWSTGNNASVGDFSRKSFRGKEGEESMVGAKEVITSQK